MTFIFFYSTTITAHHWQQSETVTTTTKEEWMQASRHKAHTTAEFHSDNKCNWINGKAWTANTYTQHSTWYYVHLMHTFSILSHISTCPCHSSTFDCLLVYCEIGTLCREKWNKNENKSMLALHSLADISLLFEQHFHAVWSIGIPAISVYSVSWFSSFLALRRKDRWSRNCENTISISV